MFLVIRSVLLRPVSLSLVPTGLPGRSAGNATTVVGSSYAYSHSGALNPVVKGSNDFFCDSYLCQAGPSPGYNGPTGLGTPNGTGAF